jgi:hypothetical protein
MSTLLVKGTASQDQWDEICVFADLILSASRDAIQGLVVVGERAYMA